MVLFKQGIDGPVARKNSDFGAISFVLSCLNLGKTVYNKVPI